MKTNPPRISLVLVAAALTAFAADSSVDREKTLRFPNDVRRNASFSEVNPDADYRHAPAAAAG